MTSSAPSDAESRPGTHMDADVAQWEEDQARKLSAPVTIGSSSESETAPTDPSTQREESEGVASHDNEGEAKSQRTFGGLSPQEAGRRSAQARRERALAQDSAVEAASSGKVILVRVPVQVGDIISRLASDARKGQTQAARELRAYLEAYPAEDETDVSALDRRTRQSLLARLLAEIEEDEGETPERPLE